MKLGGGEEGVNKSLLFIYLIKELDTKKRSTCPLELTFCYLRLIHFSSHFSLDFKSVLYTKVLFGNSKNTVTGKVLSHFKIESTFLNNVTKVYESLSYNWINFSCGTQCVLS